jgi:hypothetical protein
MKRFLFVAVLLLGCVPMGISIAGCGVNQNDYCDATDHQRVNQPTSITLQPNNTSITLAYTQTRLLATPVAKNCVGAGVSVASYAYASSNPNLLDVSPTGNLCAGTWNRNTGGGIPNYSICSAPSQATIEGLLAQGGGTYSDFYVTITASADGVTSNAVPVYSHPQVSSIVSYNSTSTTSCVPPTGITCSSNSLLIPTACVSQLANTSTGPLQYCSLVCAEALVQNATTPVTYSTQLTDITSAAGQVTYTPYNANVVTIGTTGLASPNFPGSTVVTANVSGVSGFAGLYSTCPPAKMQLAATSTSTPTFINVAPGNSQALQLATTDTDGNTISLTGLNYTSSTPNTISIGSTGVVTPLYGGNADVYASCLQPACNPSPLDYLGLLGNGLPLVSNPVRVNAPGTVSSIVYMVNFNAGNYFSALNTNTNTVSLITMPYQPNSMVISQDGSELYFGSDTELMKVVTGTNNITGDLTVPGRVLAVSPDGTSLIIAGTTKPQVGQPAGTPVVYIYAVASGSALPEGTNVVATSAHYSADGTIVYIAAGSQEYIYSANSGWTVQPLVNDAVNGNDIVVATPSVGAFYSGADTQAVDYCATQTKPATSAGPGSAVVYFPASSTNLPSDQLGISNDGLHLFTATSATAATPFTFSDACVSISPYNNYASGVCTAPVTQSGDEPVSISPCPISIKTNSKNYSTAGLLPAGATVTGIPVATSSSVLAGATTFFTAYTAFLTYTGANSGANGAVVPYYQVFDAQAAPAALGSVTLTDPGAATPTVPTAGVVSPDNTTLYVTTAGDNAVHFITIPQSVNGAAPTGKPYEDLSLNPPQSTQLPGANGGTVPADAMAIRAFRTN